MIRKFFVLTLPSLLVAGVLAAVAGEAYVRMTWEPHRGTPGLFLSDPVRGQRLAAGYDGWFAGVPVHINNLGLRADRDFDLTKGPRTFRILVLGDSVTFGHGSVETYPDLLERLLRAWRPDIDWQVWNAGVPGYNTSQELAYLEEVGPRFAPDLVIVGFFENDVIGNTRPDPPSAITRVRSHVLSWLQRHVYSLELYKRIYLQLAWQLSGTTDLRRRLEHLGTEEALLTSGASLVDRPEQRLTDYARLSDAEAEAPRCTDLEQPDPGAIEELRRRDDWPAWVDAVRGFQSLQARGAYHVLFFLNIVPPVCEEADLFYPGSTGLLNTFYLDVMGGPTPAVSAFDGFLHRRPSEMPAARAHAIGNANMTKAEILFDHLQKRALVP